jgi:hypothetical protein
MSDKRNGKRDTKAAKKPRSLGASSGRDAFRLPPEHCETISSIKPDLLEAVHHLLRRNGVDAVVHSISFRPANAGPSGEGCGYVNGVWTCSG